MNFSSHIQANLLLAYLKENPIQLQIITLNRHKVLLTAKDLSCSHRIEKKFDCVLNCKPVKVYNGLGSRTTALILNVSAVFK